MCMRVKCLYTDISTFLFGVLRCPTTAAATVATAVHATIAPPMFSLLQYALSSSRCSAAVCSQFTHCHSAKKVRTTLFACGKVASCTCAAASVANVANAPVRRLCAREVHARGRELWVQITVGENKYFNCETGVGRMCVAYYRIRSKCRRCNLQTTDLHRIV